MRSLTKRQTAFAAGTAALLVVALGGTVMLAQDDDADGDQQMSAAAATTPPPTTAPSTTSSEPTVAPTPQGTSTVAPTRSPSARPSSSRAPRSSPATSRPTRAACTQGEQRPCPDGEPGWDEGIAKDGTENVCRYLAPSEVEGRGQATLVPGLVVSIAQSRQPTFGKGNVAAELVVRNTTTRTLTLAFDDTQTGYGIAGGTYGFPDDVQITQLAVPAGQTGRLLLPEASTDTCGDTSKEGFRRLPPGSYTYSWTNVASVSSEPVVTEPPDPSASASPTATPSPDPQAWSGQRLDLVGTVRL